MSEIDFKKLPKTTVVPITGIKPNPDNPRVIKDEKFKKLVESVKQSPWMLTLRPIVVDSEMVVLGGNMRLKAAQEAGYKQIPISLIEDLTEEQKQEFVIKDNLPFGEWDWEILGEWDSSKLIEWGFEEGEFIGYGLDPDELGEEFSLADGDKSPFQQMTFTLADEQAEQIKNAIQDIKSTEEYKYVETLGNENSNGNALYLIIKQWAEQKTYA